jgi:hypothetical protein
MSLNGRGETRPQTFEPSTVNVDVPEDVSTYEEGVRRTELADGSVLFDLNRLEFLLRVVKLPSVGAAYIDKRTVPNVYKDLQRHSPIVTCW